jgi:hypothetical protein
VHGSCGRHKDGLIVHEQVLALPGQRQRVNQNGVLGAQCVADARSAHRLQIVRRCWWAVLVVLAVVIVVGIEVMEVIVVDGDGVRHCRPISKVVVVAEITGHVLVVLR